jgi:hypothetical protein
MSQEEISDAVKAMLKNKTSQKSTLKVIGYYSKVFAEADAHRPIFELELMALIGALDNFRPYISPAPACVVFIDSRTAYFLCQAGTYKSALKFRRWCVLIHAQYPNLILNLIPTEQNMADAFSRMFDMPPEVERQINIKNVVIDKIPPLENQLMTTNELQTFADNNTQYMFEAPETVQNTAQVNLICSAASMEALQSFTIPIRILRDRLTLDKLRDAQETELPHWEEIKNGHFADLNYSFTNELVHKNQKIVVPPSMEGLILSYLHLTTGHSGRNRLLDKFRQHYTMTAETLKIAAFVKHCHSCAITNNSTRRKLALRTFPIPSRPFQAIVMDLIEGMPKNHLKITDLLVITCLLTKAVYIYPVKDKSSSQILASLKIFLQHTNLTTEYLYSDNAKIFRSQQLLTFLSAIGIVVPRTSSNSSQSRGAVEIKNQLIEKILKKLLLLSPSYDFTDIYFLTSVLINNSVSNATGTTPTSLIFGEDPFDLGPLGLQHRDVSEKSKLLLGPLKADVKKLHRLISRQVNQAKQQLEKYKEGYLIQRNRHRTQEHKFVQGMLVFCRDFRVPKPGQNVKLRPKQQRSPFIVVSTAPAAVLIMRLVDSFVTQVHPSALVEFTYKSRQFRDLPKEMLDILGEPLTKESLMHLAEIDQLPLLYSAPDDTDTSGPTTRAALARRRQELAVAAELAEQEQQLEDDWDDVDDVRPQLMTSEQPSVPVQKRVRFN